MNVGILALQGAVEPHVIKLRELRADPVRVLRDSDLKDLDALILPGGESTTFLHLIRTNQLWDGLKEFSKTRPVWGICAGAILMATEVSHPPQRSLDLMDIAVERNAYGRQLQSFIDELQPESDWPGKSTVEGVFIRAPRIVRHGKDVRPLLKHRDNVVLARQGKHLISTFHPELSATNIVHDYFLKECH